MVSLTQTPPIETSLIKTSLIKTSLVADVLVAEQERAQEQLSQSPITSLRNVVCELHGNVMVLQGHVESFYVKQLAQETIRKLNQHYIIVNMLTVE